MPNKYQKIFMALVGAYLIYTGGKLISVIADGQPENEILFMIAGGIIILIGCVAVILNMKEFIRDVVRERAEAAEAEEELELEVDDAEDMILTEELLEEDAEDAEIDE